jgi:hypothetical protein
MVRYGVSGIGAFLFDAGVEVFVERFHMGGESAGGDLALGVTGWFMFFEEVRCVLGEYAVARCDRSRGAWYNRERRSDLVRLSRGGSGGHWEV